MKEYITPEIELLKLVADQSIAADEVSSGGGFGEDLGGGDIEL